MRRHSTRFAWLVLIALAGSAATLDAQPDRKQPKESKAPPPPGAFFRGTVAEVYAPRLFSMRESDGTREILVLAPRELSTVTGATVALSGTVRRFDARDLKNVRGWSDLDADLRARFAGRPVVVATGVMSTLQPEGSEPEQPGEQEPTPRPRPVPAATPGPPGPLFVRASTLVAFVDAFAGEPVRIQSARVVGFVTPGVFLVEPATDYPKMMGERDRLAVFIDGARMRITPQLLVGSVVKIEGVVRTLLSLQASREVDWPAELTPERIDRLEVRAGVIARSVATAEGTELTVH